MAHAMALSINCAVLVAPVRSGAGSLVVFEEISLNTSSAASACDKTR